MSLRNFRKSFEEEEESDQSDSEAENDDREEMRSRGLLPMSAREAHRRSIQSSDSNKRERMNASEKRLIEEKTDAVVAHFFLSVVWSIGAVLKQSSRDKFNAFFSDLCDNAIGKFPKYFILD